MQNVGAYTGADGRLIFDINDFDETIRGPFEWDVKRMATSVLLAGAGAKLKTSDAEFAAELFIDSYCGLMERLSRMAVLDVVRYQVHRLDAVSPISKILAKAERSTPMLSLDSLTVKSKNSRIFKDEPPLLRRVTGSEAKGVLGSLSLYRQSLLPERQHFFAQLRPLDVAFKVVGTGSVGLRDYCVYFEGNGAYDPLFLQIKQESPSAWTEYLADVNGPVENEGRRTAEGQRAMQLQSDPLLGWTRFDGRDYLVRQLNDHKATIDMTKLKAADLADYAAVCGELLARGHARSGDATEIAGYIGGGSRFGKAILGFAKAYATQTNADWKQLVESQKQD